MLRYIQVFLKMGLEFFALFGSKFGEGRVMYAVVSYGTVSPLIRFLCCDERLIGGIMESLSVPYENHGGRHTGNESIESLEDFVHRMTRALRAR